MPKITFMGAGSTVFARNVLGDCMCTPSLCESEIALYDIDAERLEESYIILSAINKNTNGGKATLKTYCGVENRKEALRGIKPVRKEDIELAIIYSASMLADVNTPLKDIFLGMTVWRRSYSMLGNWIS